MINVTIFNENYHEQIYNDIRKIYSNGIHGCLKQFLQNDKNLSIITCTFDLGYFSFSDENIFDAFDEFKDLIFYTEYDDYFEIEHFNAHDQLDYIKNHLNF